QGLAGPHKEVVAEDASVAQVDITLATQAGAPMTRHLGDSFRGTGQRPAEGVLHSTVDHALGGNSLIAAQGMGFEQRETVTDIRQSVGQPKARNAAADDGNIELNSNGCGRHSGSLCDGISVIKPGLNVRAV